MQISKENVTSGFKIATNLLKSVIMMFIQFIFHRNSYFWHSIYIMMFVVDLTIACTHTCARKAWPITFAVTKTVTVFTSAFQWFLTRGCDSCWRGPFWFPVAVFFFFLPTQFSGLGKHWKHSRVWPHTCPPLYILVFLYAPLKRPR